MILRFKNYKKYKKKKPPEHYYKIENGIKIMVLPIMGEPLSTKDIGPSPRKYKSVKNVS
ncbi:MAG: hypothetical protein ACHQ1D_01660 [Nitrososphaerales archaeon]|jgi:hypothetical protein